MPSLLTNGQTLQWSRQWLGNQKSAKLPSRCRCSRATTRCSIALQLSDSIGRAHHSLFVLNRPPRLRVTHLFPGVAAIILVALGVVVAAEWCVSAFDVSVVRLLDAGKSRCRHVRANSPYRIQSSHANSLALTLVAKLLIADQHAR